MKGKGYFLTCIISLVVGIVGTLLTLKYCGILDKVVEVDRTIKTVSISEQDSLKESIDKIYNSVVYIESSKNDRAIGSGSGFVYKTDNKYGYVLTNQHVIDSSTSIKITNIEGEEVEATLLGSDTFSDIAVLRIDKKSVLQVATLGSSKDVNLGDTVFTVGSPVGKTYMGTVTKGIVSGKDRTITTSNNYVTEVLQIDAALNPGNSGGPLANVNGEVIGINSLKLVQSEIEGMGFAIPVELVKTIAEKLEKGERIERPALGVSMSDVDSTYLLYRNGIVLDSSIDKGVVVVEVYNDTAASKAGLQKGDVILAINNTDIENIAYFRAELYKYNVGDSITIKLLRDNKIKEVKVKLEALKENS